MKLMMTTKNELIRACTILKEYLNPYVCEVECGDYDKCCFCERAVVYELEQLEKIIRNDKLTETTE